MSSQPTPEDQMRNAWELRRRSLSASGLGQQELLQAAHFGLTQVVATCRASGPQARLAQALHLLANVERDRNNNDEALALWEEAVAICRTVGDDLELAHKVRHLGDLQYHLGHPDLAEPHLLEAVGLYRRHSSPPPLDFANALTRLAALREATGAVKEAVGIWLEARGLFKTAEVDTGVKMCTQHISRIRGLSD